jgi:hypothetical protein
MHEFDRMYIEKTFAGVLMHRLTYLLDRLVAFYKYRDNILDFLFKI